MSLLFETLFLAICPTPARRQAGSGQVLGARRARAHELPPRGARLGLAEGCELTPPRISPVLTGTGHPSRMRVVILEYSEPRTQQTPRLLPPPATLTPSFRGLGGSCWFRSCWVGKGEAKALQVGVKPKGFQHQFTDLSGRGTQLVEVGSGVRPVTPRIRT